MSRRYNYVRTKEIGLFATGVCILASLRRLRTELAPPAFKAAKSSIFITSKIENKATAMKQKDTNRRSCVKLENSIMLLIEKVDSGSTNNRTIFFTMLINLHASKNVKMY